MRGHKYLYPKTIELNINIDENSLRNGSIPVEPLRLATCHRQKPFPTQTFIKKDLLSNKFDKENNENTNVFSNLHSKKIKVCDQSDFQSNLKKKDDNYIKNLRGVLKKELFKKGHKKYESNYNNNSVKNEVNLNLKAKNHFEDCDEDDKEMVFQSFQENFLFDLKTCKKMLAYLDFLDLLNFQYVCKKTFSSQFKSVIKRLVCKYVIKVFSIYVRSLD